MVRKLILLGCLLGLAQSAWAVPALVRRCPDGANGITGGNNAGTSVTCAFVSNTAANAIFIYGEVDQTTGTLTISDTAGNTYTNIWNQVTSSSNRTSISSGWIACNANASAGTNTVTFSTTVAAANSIYVGGAEYSGLATASCLDQTTSNQNTGTASWTSGSITTTVASELAIAASEGGDGSSTCTAGTNWTLQGHTNTGNSSPCWEDQILSITQAINAAMTYTATPNGRLFIASIKTPTAAGGGAVKKKKYIFLALPMVEPILY